MWNQYVCRRHCSLRQKLTFLLKFPESILIFWTVPLLGASSTLIKTAVYSSFLVWEMFLALWNNASFCWFCLYPHFNELMSRRVGKNSWYLVSRHSSINEYLKASLTSISGKIKWRYFISPNKFSVLKNREICCCEFRLVQESCSIMECKKIPLCVSTYGILL